MRTRTWPDDPHIRKLLRLADPYMRCALLLAADAGCRLGEALSFRIDGLPGARHTHVDDTALTRLRIWAPKTRTWRTVPITRRLARAIRALPNPHLSPPLYPRYVQRRLNELAAAARLPKTSPHRWRHSFATRLAAAQVPTYIISALLGHKSLATTMIYLHTGPDQFELARAALDRLAGSITSHLTTRAERSLQRQIDALSAHVEQTRRALAALAPPRPRGRITRRSER